MNTKPNAPPAVTIKDVALAAGVHPASVSRALNGQDKRVSAETRLRIQQAARDLGYQPNAIAASLRTKQTGLIGIIVPDIGNPLFSPLLQALEIALRRHGQMCLVIQTPEDPQERRQVVHALAGRQISGLLILASENDDPMLEAAAQFALPTVLVNRGHNERRFSRVINDDRESVRLVMEHLAELGHKRVGHIAGPTSASTGHARRQAFEEMLPALGMEGVAVAAKVCTREAGLDAARELLANHEGITAIFGSNDLIALGILDALHERGLRIPEDVSVVGHNDMPFVDLIDPPLTTVRVATEEMGRQAVQLLMEHLANPTQQASMRVLPPQLTVRKSTQAPPKRARAPLKRA